MDYFDDLLGSSLDSMVRPLWDISSRNKQYVEFDLYATRNDCVNDMLLNKINSNSYKCHICDINVPKIYFNLHISSAKHKIFTSIVENCLDRMKNQIKACSMIENDILKPTNVYFCDICTIVVKESDKLCHNLSEQHLYNAAREKQIVIFENLLTNLEEERKINNIIYTNSHSTDNKIEEKKHIVEVKIDQSNNRSKNDHKNIETEAIGSKILNTLENVNPLNVEKWPTLKPKILITETAINNNREAKPKNSVEDLLYIRKLSKKKSHCSLCNENFTNINLHIIKDSHLSQIKSAKANLEIIKKQSNETKQHTISNIDTNQSFNEHSTSDINDENNRKILIPKTVKQKNLIFDYFNSKDEGNTLCCIVCNESLPNCPSTALNHLDSPRHNRKFNKMLQKNKIVEIHLDKFYCTYCKHDIVKGFELIHIVYNKFHIENMSQEQSNIDSEAQSSEDNALMYHYEETEIPTQLRCKVCDVKVPYTKVNTTEHVISNKHATNYKILLDYNKVIKPGLLFYCGVCKVNIVNKKELDHIETISHKSKITLCAQSRSSESNINEDTIPTAKQGQGTSKPDEAMISQTKNPTLPVFDFFCKICCIKIPNNPYSRKAHSSSNQHTFNLQKYVFEETKTDKQINCLVCKNPIGNSLTSVQEHISGKKHKINYEKLLTDNLMMVDGDKIVCKPCDALINKFNEIVHIQKSGHMDNVKRFKSNGNKVEVLNVVIPNIKDEAGNAYIDEHNKENANSGPNDKNQRSISEKSININIVKTEDHLNNNDDKYPFDFNNDIEDFELIDLLNKSVIHNVKPLSDGDKKYDSTADLRFDKKYHYKVSEKPSVLNCLVCRVEVPNAKENIIQHFNSAKHNKKYHVLLRENRIESNGDTFFCSICEVNITMEKELHHMNLKSHKSKLLTSRNSVVPTQSNLIETKQAKVNSLPVKGKQTKTTVVPVENSDNQASTNPNKLHITTNELNAPSTSMLSLQFFCDICNITIANNPESRKSHADCFKLQSLNDTGANNEKSALVDNKIKYMFEETVDKEFYCKVCKKTTGTSYDLMQIHAIGRTHIRKYKKILLKNFFTVLDESIKCMACCNIIENYGEFAHIETVQHINNVNKMFKEIGEAKENKLYEDLNVVLQSSAIGINTKPKKQENEETVQHIHNVKEMKAKEDKILPLYEDLNVVPQSSAIEINAKPQEQENEEAIQHIINVEEVKAKGDKILPIYEDLHVVPQSSAIENNVKPEKQENEETVQHINNVKEMKAKEDKISRLYEDLNVVPKSSAIEINAKPQEQENEETVQHINNIKEMKAKEDKILPIYEDSNVVLQSSAIEINAKQQLTKDKTDTIDYQLKNNWTNSICLICHEEVDEENKESHLNSDRHFENLIDLFLHNHMVFKADFFHCKICDEDIDNDIAFLHLSMESHKRNLFLVDDDIDSDEYSD